MNDRSLERLDSLLYEKLKNEYDTFIKNIERKKPKEIVNSAYEIVTKQDILMLFENKEPLLSEKQTKALFSTFRPLDRLYNNWLEVEDDYMIQLKDSIENEAEKLSKSKQKRIEKSDIIR